MGDQYTGVRCNPPLPGAAPAAKTGGMAARRHGGKAWRHGGMAAWQHSWRQSGGTIWRHGGKAGSINATAGTSLTARRHSGGIDNRGGWAPSSVGGASRGARRPAGRARLTPISGAGLFGRIRHAKRARGLSRVAIWKRKDPGRFISWIRPPAFPPSTFVPGLQVHRRVLSQPRRDHGGVGAAEEQNVVCPHCDKRVGIDDPRPDTAYWPCKEIRRQ
eukprot:gene352-biopygen10746